MKDVIAFFVMMLMLIGMFLLTIFEFCILHGRSIKFYVDVMVVCAAIASLSGGYIIVRAAIEMKKDWDRRYGK